MKQIGWFIAIAALVMLEVATAPGTSRNGLQWTLSRSNSNGRVHFQVERSRPGSRSINGSDAPLSAFHGFSLDQLERSGPVKFEYVRAAGKLVCDGRVAWGRASGSFTMEPNAQFLSELAGLGFGTPREDELYSMIQSDLDLAFARAVHDAGMGGIEQLLELRNHGVKTEFIGEVRRAGYTNLRAHDYVELRDHGVGVDFMETLKTAGYSMPVTDIVELRNHGVKARFVEDLKYAGYKLTAEEISNLTNHGVDSSFVRDLKFYNLHPDAAEMVAMRQHGVTPEYLRAMHDAGYIGISGDEVSRLHEHGVASQFAQSAHDLGYKFTVEELIDLRNHGVDAAYLKNLRDSGIQGLTPPQITKLRDHGVN